ncbi:hypothetical protein SEA_PH8S_34 [Mycobacterium phage Ph8s]|nr:hypothetical protein SEA_PH8S_34 [Mycobacterium phage Ph8s]
MTNPTNLGDYDFYFCFETKGMKWNGLNVDPDTWYPNIQHGGRGDGHMIPLIFQAYEDAIPAARDQPDVLRIWVLYTPPVTWTEIDPDDVGTLPEPIDNYTFGVLFDVLDDTVEPPAMATGGMIGDGSYGLEYAAALDGYVDNPMAYNPRFVYAPKLDYTAWQFD